MTVSPAKLLVFDRFIPVPARVIVPPLAVNVPIDRENDPLTDIVPAVIENVPFVWLKPPLTVRATLPTESVPPKRSAPRWWL